MSSTNREGNAFESGSRVLVPTSLVYLFNSDRSKVLLIHRDGRSDGAPDFHQGKWNGLGGKLEADESPEQGAMRELTEEAGLKSPPVLHSLGWVLFPLFKPQKAQDVVTFVFEGTLDDQTASKLGAGERRDEGTLHWVSVNQIKTALGLPVRDFRDSRYARQLPISKIPFPEVKEPTGPESKDLRFWPGDSAFLPSVLDGIPFWGTIRYNEGDLVGAEIYPLRMGAVLRNASVL